jgi:hypothetical protein
MARDIADGATVSFGSVFSSLKLANISHSGLSRNTVDASHLATSGGKEFLASSMYDPGELSCEVHFDPSLKDNDCRCHDQRRHRPGTDDHISKRRGRCYLGLVGLRVFDGLRYHCQ